MKGFCWHLHVGSSTTFTDNLKKKSILAGFYFLVINVLENEFLFLGHKHERFRLMDNRLPHFVRSQPPRNKSTRRIGKLVIFYSHRFTSLEKSLIHFYSSTALWIMNWLLVAIESTVQNPMNVSSALVNRSIVSVSTLQELVSWVWTEYAFGSCQRIGS